MFAKVYKWTDELCVRTSLLSSFIVFDAYHFIALMGKQMELHAIPNILLVFHYGMKNDRWVKIENTSYFN